MAITNLVPVFDRIAKPNLRVIAGNLSVEKIHPKKFIILIATVFGLCFLLQSVVSIMNTSDAFALQSLKRERNLIQDQRDAILVEVNQKSSPDALAVAAGKLGMKPAESVSYIDLSSR